MESREPAVQAVQADSAGHFLGPVAPAEQVGSAEHFLAPVDNPDLAVAMGHWAQQQRLREAAQEVMAGMGVLAERMLALEQEQQEQEGQEGQEEQEEEREEEQEEYQHHLLVK